MIPQVSVTPSFEEGLALFRAERIEEAVSLLQTILAHCPGDPESRHVLALSLRKLGQLDQAVTHLAEVIRLQPGNAEAWSNYGAMLRERGRFQEANEALKCAVELDPDSALAWNNLGTVQLDLTQIDEARWSFEKALSLDPQCAEAMANSSRVWFESGDLGRAKKAARYATALAPSLPEAHNRLATVQSACGDVEESIKSMRNAANAAPDNDLYAGNALLRALSSDRLSRTDLKHLAETWGKKYSTVAPRVTGTLQRIHRIGFLSGDLRQHPVGYFVEPLINHLQADVDIVAYNTGSVVDDLSRRLQTKCSAWRNVHRASADSIVEQMVEDDLDILVDLAGHTRDGRLDVVAQHPARATVSWLGYSGTTGLPQMDAILADQWLIPSSHEDGYTERVLRLPDSFLCLDGSHVGNMTADDWIADFAVLNNPSKFSEAAFAAWATILAKAPGTTILFKYHNLHDAWVQAQIQGRFEDAGIDPNRIRFASTMSYSDHLVLVSRCRVALDTFPYTGATTTIDCLAAGVPVVSLTGDHYAGRMTTSLMLNLGRPETLCSSVRQYVDTAVALSSNESLRRECGSGLADALRDSQICDGKRFAEAWLQTLHSLID